MVEVHCPWERVGVGPLLQDDDRPAALGQLDPQDETHRAGSDDRDVHKKRGVVLVWPVHADRSGW
jgi:hypothetical protein